MTLPDERYRAVIYTRDFLLELTDPKAFPKIPRRVRDRAAACLRHYPSTWDMMAAARGVPEVFAERMDPLHRMIVKYEQDKGKNEDRS